MSNQEKTPVARVSLILLCLSIFFLQVQRTLAQDQTELKSGWNCILASSIKEDGTSLSKSSFALNGWMKAVIPGTVLTSLMENKKAPDPFYGMNNKLIPDIYTVGRDYYTYWFETDFKEKFPVAGTEVYLNLRGVNYSYDVYLNGHKLNHKPEEGMFLRHEYLITPFLNKDGQNRLALLVHPAPFVGNANGGQGGDGTIAKGVATQYTAGWDWIQPIRDRNTGIWDKVTIYRTQVVHLKNPHVITIVPGVREVKGIQGDAFIKLSAELENPSSKPVTGTLQYTLAGQTMTAKLILPAHSSKEYSLKGMTLKNPKLWWPNGYGEQNLYTLRISFLTAGKISDSQEIKVGVREIKSNWNDHTRSAQLFVNGQPIFIKGGDWIISDAMLRFSDARFDAEIRFHHDMNLNLIRIWGGALIERPEFYAACDKYGMLVFQDLWVSGDCNGRWEDPMKKDDQWTRRKYPDDHALFIASAVDQIKMIRNHPSLAIWCGGNEITPPEDILLALRDTLMPKLDGTRWFVDFSNSEKMSQNTLGGNGDGPYGIQKVNYFFEHRTYPFNSEIGSIGLGDYESLKRFIPGKDMVTPTYPPEKVDSVWNYHKYIGYDGSIDAYGKAKDVKDFADKAQLVNYDQYRALMEGFSAHMWDWYTGVIIWKTQNPWTAMRGQMYDYYLDPNACLYGLHNGSEPLHVFYNPSNGMISVVNNTLETRRDLMLSASIFDMNGKEIKMGGAFQEMLPSSVKNFVPVKRKLEAEAKEEGAFLSLKLLDKDQHIVSSNIYWEPNEQGIYSGLQKMPAAQVNIQAVKKERGVIEVAISNKAGGPLAFFSRVSLLDAQTHSRILPAFYDDNYVSILPGEEKKIRIEYKPSPGDSNPEISVKGWNVSEKIVQVSN